MFDLSAYQYSLPQELIAQYPSSPRDHSRLMIIERNTGNISEIVFHDIVNLLKEPDSLVFNDTKVIPLRLFGRKSTGAHVEMLLTRRITEDTWECLARPGRRLHPGTQVSFSGDFFCEIIETKSDGSKVVRFHYSEDFHTLLETHGQIPLPHYMKRDFEASDRQNYQTTYASQEGAAAVPSAGLHFTPELLKELSDRSVSQTTVTLHVGVGTFRPVKAKDIRDHPMHTEHFFIKEEAAQKLNQRSPNGKQIIVGTTTCRALESAATDTGIISSGEYDTNIFIYPGYQFKYVRGLLTNFHLPGSSLLMLVCAFAGYDLTMEAYAKAIKDRYRFYTYGDAMLII